MALPHSGSELSRRRFLAALAAPVVLSACGRAPYRAADFLVPARSPVCLYPAADYRADFARIIGDGLAALDVAVDGRRVLLKPNLVEYEQGSAVNTHAAVVAGAVEALRRRGASDVIVAEGPGHRRDLEYLLTQSGLYDRLKDLGVRFVDLNHDDVRPVTLRSRFMGLTQLWLPVEMIKADLIVSMPKLKTHHWTGLTASMKNLFGAVPGAVYGWPKNFLHTHGIENSILDLNATLRPGLAIVDAVVGMEGDGPIMGRPRSVGFVAIGTDPVAVDATLARVIGLDPSRMPYLLAASRFLGNVAEAKIELRAEPLSRYRTRFDMLPRFDPLRLPA